MAHKKGSEMRLCLVILVFFLVACSEKREPATAQASIEYLVVGVNDQPIMFSDTQVGGLIHFNSDDFTLCTLAFAKDVFAAAESFEVVKLGEGDYDLTCLADEDHFSLDHSEFSFLKGKMVKQGAGIMLELEFSLLGVRSNQYLYKGGVALKLNKAQMDQLGLP